MPFPITENTRRLLESGIINPNLILEIDGIPTIYGTDSVRERVRFDSGYLFDDGQFFDTPAIIDNTRPYIMLNGTTRNITQQLQIDTNVGTSIQSVNIAIADIGEYVTRELTTGAVVEDVIGRRAKFYLGFAELAHPDDSIKLFDGIVQEVSFPPGQVNVRVQHPESLKNIQIFPTLITVLNENLSAVDTTITIIDASLFPTPVDSLQTYVQIEDEIIEYTGKSGNNLTGCIRGQLGTVAAVHNGLMEDIEVNLRYRLTGNPIELALKLMLSGGNQFYNFQASPTSFVLLADNQVEANAIQLIDNFATIEGGVVKGMFVTSTGATNGANNFVDREILAVLQNDQGTVLIVDGAPLVIETPTMATLNFKSQYDVFDAAYIGSRMTPEQVDVQRHQEFLDNFTSNFPNVDFFIASSVSAKDFIHAQLYRPVGLYAIPRGSRASCNYTNPPLALDQIVRIDSNNVLNPEQLTIKRSIAQYFYNSINHKFEESRLEEGKFLRGISLVSEDSFNRFKQYGSRPMVIESRGLRADPNTEIVIEIVQRRLSERYKFIAESIDNVRINFQTGLPIEIGDVVVFGDAALQIADNKSQSRNFQPRLMEVINKSISINGECSLTLLDTAFSLDGRYGVVSLSSLVGVGSTNEAIVTRNFPHEQLVIAQREKWRDFLGELIQVRSADYTQVAQTRLLRFRDNDPRVMVVAPPLPFVPASGSVVEIIDYHPNLFEGGIYKNLFVYLNPQVPVVTGISPTQFTVSGPNIAKFFVGSFIEVHNIDYSTVQETRITDIMGTTITVSPPLSFTPNNTFVIDLIGFSDDEGLPYRII